MNNQEAFNKVWTHFVVENNPPAMTEEGTCVYRTVEGHKCAFGILIPDELYDPKMEGLSPESVIYQFPSLNRFLQLDKYLITSLQQAHDNAAPTSKGQEKEFKRDLITYLLRVAEDYNLTIPKEVE